MKALKSKYSVLIAFLILAIAGRATAGAYAGTPAGDSEYMFRKNKHYVKSFKVVEGVSVDVRNKYGQIIFTNWDKDSVRFEVEIVSEGDRLDHVLENMEAVSVDFTGNKVYVEAQTNWRDEGFIRKSVNDIKRSLSGSEKLEVNYRVYLPKGSDINVDNRFGDVYLTDVKGTLNADISHGNLRAGSISKIRRLKIRYGDVRFQSCGYASIDAAFGDVEIESAEELNLTTSTTDVVLGNVRDLNFISKNDHVDIEEVQVLSATLALTDLRINKLGSKADVNSKMGSIRLKKIDPEFTRLHFTGSYTSYTIITDSGMNTGFKVTMENGREFTYPKSVSVTSKDVVEKTEIYKGQIGTGGENRIIIQSKSGQVRFEM